MLGCTLADVENTLLYRAVVYIMLGNRKVDMSERTQHAAMQSLVFKYTSLHVSGSSGLIMAAARSAKEVKKRSWFKSPPPVPQAGNRVSCYFTPRLQNYPLTHRTASTTVRRLCRRN